MSTRDPKTGKYETLQAIAEGIGQELLERGVKSRGLHSRSWTDLVVKIKSKTTDGKILEKEMIIFLENGYARTSYEWRGRQIDRYWEFNDPKFPENLVRFCQVVSTDEEILAALSNQALKNKRANFVVRYRGF